MTLAQRFFRSGHARVLHRHLDGVHNDRQRLIAWPPFDAHEPIYRLSIRRITSHAVRSLGWKHKNASVAEDQNSTLDIRWFHSGCSRNHSTVLWSPSDNRVFGAHPITSRAFAESA